MKRWTEKTVRATSGNRTLYALTSDGDALYWKSCPQLGAGCTLFRLAHDAPFGAETALLNGAVRAFAVGLTDVFVAMDEQVVRVPKHGGAATVIERELPLYDVAVAGDVIYGAVADTRNLQGGGPGHPGKLVRFAASGGPVAELAPLASSMPRLVVDGERVYITGDHGIDVYERGALSPLVGPAQVGSGAIAVDRGTLYVSTGTEVRRGVGSASTVMARAQIILAVRASHGRVFATRNVSYAMGEITEEPAILELEGAAGEAAEVTPLDGSPQSLAVDGGGVYVILTDLRGGEADRIVAFPR